MPLAFSVSTTSDKSRRLTSGNSCGALVNVNGQLIGIKRRMIVVGPRGQDVGDRRAVVERVVDIRLRAADVELAERGRIAGYHGIVG